MKIEENKATVRRYFEALNAFYETGDFGPLDGLIAPDYVYHAETGDLSGIAAQIPGLNLSAWRSIRSDPALVSQVSADQQAGHAAGVQGTPTLVFQGPKGQAQAPSGIPSYSDLQNTIKSVT